MSLIRGRVHAFVMSRLLVVRLLNKLQEILLRRPIAYNCHIEIGMLVEVQSPPDSSDDPIGFVAKRTATEKREKQSVISISYRIQDRNTDRRLIGSL